MEGKLADKAKLWTWDFSRAVVNGISDLIRSLNQNNRNSSETWNVDASLEQMVDTKWDEADTAIFPVENEPDKQADTKKCPGCRGYQNKNDPSHTRIAGECRWPFAATIHWECAACEAKEPF